MVPGTDLSIVPDPLRRRIAHRPQLLKIIDNIGWLFFDKVLRMGVGLLVGVWIARYLGPEQFGLLSFATAFVGLFGAFAGLGLQGIVVRDIVLEPAGKGETLGTAAVLHVLGGLVAYGLILLVIFWLRPEDTLAKTLVAILGSMMLFKASDVAVYWFESQVLSKYTVLVQNGTFLAFALVKVVLILQDAPLVLFAWMVMGEAFAGAVLMFWAISRVGFPLAGLRATAIRAGEMLRASWPLLVSGVAITVYMKVDQIMLGQIIGDKAVGLYSAATRISEVWYFVPMAIVASVLPAILQSRMASEAQYYRRLQLLFDVDAAPTHFVKQAGIREPLRVVSAHVDIKTVPFVTENSLQHQVFAFLCPRRLLPRIPADAIEHTFDEALDEIGHNFPDKFQHQLFTNENSLFWG